MQLLIEAFLLEALIPKRIQVKIRKIAIVVTSYCYQLKIQFPANPLTERFQKRDRITGKMVWTEREINMKKVKSNRVGSPINMRKIIKDEHYLSA